MNLLMMVSKETLSLILIANVIAWPIAYFVMQSWLQNFAYRIDLSLTPFILTICTTIALGIMAISYYALKLIRENPVVIFRDK